MSAAAATTADAGAAPPKKGKKKLVIIIAAVLVLALAGGGVAFYLKSKAAHAAAEAEGEDGAAPAAEEHAKVDPKHPPSFLPLDPFVVNLADKDAERYAQVGITLEVDNAVFAEQMKTYMPAVRNAILMILAHKSSSELLTHEGKDALAAEIMREAVRPMGIEIDADEAEAKPAHGKGADGEADADAEAKPKAKAKRKKKKAAEHNPVQHVLFSNFIIQ